MNVDRLCTFGYFDRIVVDGYTIPMFNAKGITIKNDENLIEAVNNNYNSYDQGIGKLRLTIYGEAEFNISDDNLLNMRFHREQKLGLMRIKVDNNDRYAIAYADILILKNNANDLDKKEQINEMLKRAKTEDEAYLLSKAIEIQNRDLKKYNANECNIAIVEKVYVNKAFRGCKISSWIHDNIGDIVKTFGMVDISASLLIPGDFAGESKLFRMDPLEYKVFLAKHYKHHGYVILDKPIMYKDLKEKSNKFLKF
jgi:hypothetical protein